MVTFDKRKAAVGIKQETFDFLGFTFYWGNSRAGKIIPKLQTRSKTIKAKLKRVTEWAREVRHKASLKEIWTVFKAKLRGHIQYYGVSFNYGRVSKFCDEAVRILYKWLNRRSQRKSFNWEKFSLFMEKNPLPKVKIAHKLF